jgi:hypothetical protein
MGGGAAVAAAAGGWYFFLRESTPGGPEGVVHDYVDAFESGDAQAMDELVHQNSPVRGGMGDPISQVEENENSNLSASVESTEILNREQAPNTANVEEFATVKATISTSRGDQPSETSTLRFVVAKNSNGEWKFWEQTFATQEETGQSTTETMPTAAFAFDYVPGSGQNGDGLLTITLSSGDSIPAQELFIQGQNVARVGFSPAGNSFSTNWAVLTDASGSGDVVAGDSVELEAMSDYEASVVWESQTSDSSAVLSEGEGPDA